ncbi:winged helix-turn-helix domain-containing protein [Kitasatospora sp. NPDC050463]|uniref:winged helix-turn-helix domain-containing protein n=1 Tax=Kitasatospora sp. NPDC050463 TaxID=3155786 RepID=UPI0033C5811C
MTRVLVVDDEPQIVRALVINLKARTYEVDSAHDGASALEPAAARHLWGPAYRKETDYLRVYLAQLRRTLEADPSHPRHFITEPGMGYRFEP